MLVLRLSVALGVAVGAVPALAQHHREVAREFQGLWNQSRPEDDAACEATLPSQLRSRELTREQPGMPLTIQSREQYVGQVIGMDAAALAAEDRRLSIWLADALANPRASAMPAEELYAMRELVREAIELGESGQRLTWQHNSYWTYAESHPDLETQYRIAMTDCLVTRYPFGRQEATPPSQARTLSRTSTRLQQDHGPPDQHYSYGDNWADLLIIGDGQDYRRIRWYFDNVPTSVTPGREFTINVRGEIDFRPLGAERGANNSAGVRVQGATAVEETNAYFYQGASREGKYTYLVPTDATRVIVELGADNNQGIFIRHCYGECP